MNSALPGQAIAPGAAEAERVRREVARPPWRLDAPAGKATARSAARNTGQPPAHLQLAGSPWLWRPATLFALTIAAATGVALLPAAAAGKHRS
jgi:hypothetical protein